MSTSFYSGCFRSDQRLPVTRVTSGRKSHMKADQERFGTDDVIYDSDQLGPDDPV